MEVDPETAELAEALPVAQSLPDVHGEELAVALPAPKPKGSDWQAKVPRLANWLLLLLSVMLIGRFLLSLLFGSIASARDKFELVVAIMGPLAFFAWPMALCLWLRAAQRPPLVRPASFSVLLIPLLQIPAFLGVVLGLSLGARQDTGSWFSPFVNPLNITLQALFFVLAVILCRRSWRVYREFRGPVRGIGPSRPQPQALGAPLAWTATILFAVTAVGFAAVGGVSSLSYRGGFRNNLARRFERSHDQELLQAGALVNSGTERIKNDPLGAEKDLREALAIYEAIYESLEPDDHWAWSIRENKTHARNNLVIALNAAGKYQLCIDEARKAMALAELHRPRFGDTWEVRRICLYNIGASLTALGRFQEAIVEYRAAMEVYQQLSREKRIMPYHNLEWANCRIGLSLALLNVNQAPDAESELRQAGALLEKLPAHVQDKAQAQADLASARQELQRRMGAANNFAPKGKLSNGKQQSSDADILKRAALAGLETLDLSGTQVSNAGLGQLKELTNLKTLLLNNTKVGDDALVHVTALANLRELALNGTTVSDVGLRHLKTLTNLTNLGLGNTEVSDAGLEQLKGMTNLRDLYLVQTKVSDAGLAHLRTLTQLGGLHLGGTAVSDAGLAHLTTLSELKHLGLGGTRITDAGLEQLKGLTNLQHLDVTGTKVTVAGVDALRQAMPNCEILSNAK
jgi:tetratricopeptide (TPR) repeat protein